MGNPMDEVKQERRSTPRQKSFLQGRVMFNNRRSSIDCIVRDVGDNSARLKFSITPAVPDSFELYIPNKDEWFHAHVVWHDGTEMGVTLGAAEPAPMHPTTGSLEERVAKLERELAALKRKLDETSP